jgi:hypothetical protein
MEQKVCQSCGMPMTAEDLCGTNADGSLNDEYCKYCYDKGAFHNPNETLEGMVNTCAPFMVEQGVPEKDARAQLNELLPQLKRWKQS